MANLDRIDYEILAHLQKDAWMSNKDLAARVNLAPSSCYERVKKLRKSDILLGANARVNPSMLGIGLQAMVSLKFSTSSLDLFKSLKRSFLALPEVVTLYLVSGANDLLVHVAVRDADHLRDMVLNQFASRDEIANCETLLIFEAAFSPPFPHYPTKE